MFDSQLKRDSDGKERSFCKHHVEIHRRMVSTETGNVTITLFRAIWSCYLGDSFSLTCLKDICLWCKRCCFVDKLIHIIVVSSVKQGLQCDKLQRIMQSVTNSETVILYSVVEFLFLPTH